MKNTVFLKWAGGKSQLLPQLDPLLPKQVQRYFEPFLGSGAMFFHIIQKYQPREVFLSDTNEEVINLFKVVQSHPDKLIVALKKHKRLHTDNPQKHYLHVRALVPHNLSNIDRAARMIYLNRTCWNGLYRVNSKGQFNVPMGRYNNPDIVQEEKLLAAAELLKNVHLELASFETVLDKANKNDFVYLDPPYYPIKAGVSFTSYTKDNFLEEQQKKLAGVFDRLTKKGCFVMESNSDSSFIKKLYAHYTIRKVSARRLINSKPHGRGVINELVITNYSTD